ncbi:glutamate mutase L [Pseudonocardia sp. ICBG601]|uniref:glutamate mutase L n=1 Tax=Pseudonocardia sp. ICBG601 TaxID=2846759 RepID=UPI001CF62923|nr:glutamate mutase L [Pseudonocardia sp. ICBG601]
MTDASPDDPHTPAVCLDVGSCWTKAVLVLPDGTPAGFAEHPTTPDVLTGVDAAVAAAAAAAGRRRRAAPRVLACSSAGGALRLAVVGAETLTATEAGHRVCRSAGARVVGVHPGPLEPDAVLELSSRRPGAVLLLGGADGADPAVLLHNAGRLARTRGHWPVLLSVGEDARADALGLLLAGGRAVTTCPNVTPQPGTIVAGPARDAVAALYARHVLGSGTGRFGALVRSGTHAAVGDGAGVLARLTGTGVLVVDVGSATTDVHRHGPGSGPAAATEEGDLGGARRRRRRPDGGPDRGHRRPGRGRPARPGRRHAAGVAGHRARRPGAAAEDRRLAAIAAVVALRRHLRHTGVLADPAQPEPGPDTPSTQVSRSRRPHRGGVFRQRDAAGLAAAARTVRHDAVLAPLLARAEVRVDSESVLAPAGCWPPTAARSRRAGCSPST